MKFEIKKTIVALSKSFFVLGARETHAIRKAETIFISSTIKEEKLQKNIMQE